MMNEEILLRNGQNEKSIDVSSFAKGGYILLIENANAIVTKTFVVQ
jgi:hypothetical protein